jgi:hypothetical protein
MARAKSGGGITSNKRKEVPVRTGKPETNKIRVAAVSELGQKLGTHVTEKAGRLPDPSLRLRDGTAVQVDSGNRRAVETPCKPGGGRNIYRAGFQAQTGAVVKGERNVAPDVPATRTVGRDILRDYGKERSR